MGVLLNLNASSRGGHMMKDKLAHLFSPASIAVIGASNSFDKLGYHVMKSLSGNYQGKIFPINPKSNKIWGIDSYPSLETVPGNVDLAVIVVPAGAVAETIRACGRKGVKGVVLITAGFREIEDPGGGALEENIRDIAAQFELPIIGPNTFGFVNLSSGVNASFTSEFSQIEKGGVALISQSGGMCHLCGFLAITERIGMSKLMSLGNRCNVDFPALLPHLAEKDDSTKVIALYIEGLDAPRHLLAVAKSLRGKKPILAYKAGKSEKGDSASKFHTGSLAGNYEIWKGAFRQAGILEVTSTEELLDTAKVLDSCPLPGGTSIAVLSGQAGPGMIASDALGPEGLRLSKFSEVTQGRINKLLPPIAIRTNPVDMGPAWYKPENIIEILKTVIDDHYTDGVIFLAMYASANLKLAEGMAEYMKKVSPFRKPVIACFTAPPGIWDDPIKAIDRKKGVAILPTPERAVTAMANLWKVSVIMNGKG